MQQKVEEIIGWKSSACMKRLAARVVLKNFCSEILELDSGEKAYFALLPELTVEEARLLNEIMKCFQETRAKKTKRELDAFLEEYCLENRIMLDKEQFSYFLQTLNSGIFGFSALDCFLSDAGIEEIAIIGSNRPVFVFHRDFGWLETNVCFGRDSFVNELVNKMARSIGRRLTLECPKLNARLPDGSRLAASIAPISESTSVTIRKFRAEPFTPADLIENNTFSAEACAFIWLALELESSMVIAGNTGSGKTSTLNCVCALAIGKHERIIAVEETPEIVLPHGHIVKMSVVKEQDFGMPSLIIDTLRMRPDRVIVGEIRHREEALAFMDTLLAGQGKGSYATFHAQCSKEAVARFKSFGISELDLDAIDLLAVQRRWAAGSRVEKRRIVEVCELVFSKGRLGLNVLFEFDFANDCLRRKCRSEKVFAKARDFLGLDREGFEAELSERKKFLESFCGKKISRRDFFNALEQWKK